MRKSILKLLVILYVFTGVFSSWALSAELIDDGTTKKVLLIHSYHEGFSWTDDINASIQGKLGTYSNIEIYTEYMDCYRLYDDNTYPNFYQYLKNKYANMTFDVIVVSDNNAYDFMGIYYDELFSNIPVVFMGVNNFTMDQLINSNFTGLAQAGTLEENLDLITLLHKDVEQIILCGGNTTTALADVTGFEALMQTVKYSRLDYQIMMDHNVEDQINKLKSVSKKSAIIITGTSKDRKDNLIIPSDYASLIMKETHIPVYAMSMVYLENNGAIGGKVSDASVHANIVSDYVIALLEGQPVSALEVQIHPVATYIFNYERLQEFNIRTALLPNYKLLGMPDNQLGETRKIVYTYLIVVTMLLLFIVTLVINSKRRKKAEKLVNEQNMELEAYNEELIASSDELNRQFEELAIKNQEIEFLAYYDSVTTLMKKERLLEMIDTSIPNLGHRKIAMYNIAIKNLKDVTDTFGIEIEDKLLQKTAKRIIKHFNDDQYLYGSNHDEFLLVNIDVGSIDIAEQECLTVSGLLTKPYIEDDREIDLKISVGYSILPDISQSAYELFVHSDLAKMEASRKGNDQISIYHQSYYNLILKRIRIEKQLVQALKNNNFVLYYQPKVNIKSGEILGFEALIRWIKDDGTMVCPNDFIPTAEETELIIPIGEWVLNEACHQMEKWNEMGYNYKVSVNVSTVQLENDFFLYTVERALANYNIEPGQLELEITETTVMHNISECTKILEALSNLGVIISLDDFGSGYSSMTYIKSLPISKIKIDRLFVEGIEEKRQSLLASSMIQIGKALGFIINVEGVETLSQLKIIEAFEVDEIQGYYFSRPLPCDELMLFINQFQQNSLINNDGNHNKYR